MGLIKTITSIALLLPLSCVVHAQEGPRTDINPNAKMVAETELQIDASPDAVWAVLTDVDRWTEWLPEFASARLDGPLAAGTKLYWEPQGQAVVSELVIVEPSKLLVWTGSGGAVHVWELSANGSGTSLRNAESIEDWEFPGDHADQSAFLTNNMNAWNARLAERVASHAD
jgi:uncharacterized protein YndB with AHSA1/START domain